MREIRRSLVKVSRRYSRVAHEVEDLAHDLILSALRRGLPLESETFLRGFQGAARRHGAFLARSAGRRRGREMRLAGEEVAGGAVFTGEDVVERAPLSVLSPALRTTLFLLFLGLEKAELRRALGVTDAALRKRFQALRDHGPLSRPSLPVPARTPAVAQRRRNQVRLLNRLGACAADRYDRRVLAATDPDGHGLIFAEVLTPGRLAATSGAPRTDARARAKGKPCSTTRSRTSPSSS